jgi:hypothetical protein
MEDLSADRDEKVCLDSIVKLKAVVRARGEHKQHIEIHLTMPAVKILDKITKVRMHIVLEVSSTHFQGLREIKQIAF